MILLKKYMSTVIVSILLGVCLSTFSGMSAAKAESPGPGRKCSHEQFLSNTTAQGRNGNWYQCSGSGISITKSGKGKRHYSWVQIENPTVNSDARPGELCFTPFEIVRTKVGKLKCLPGRVKPPAFFWVKQ